MPPVCSVRVIIYLYVVVNIHAQKIISTLISFIFRVDRPAGTAINYDMTARGKRSMVVDLKKKESTAVITKMAKNVDVLIEPFRTGTDVIL